MVVFGIDPGSAKSAIVNIANGCVLDAKKLDNLELLDYIELQISSKAVVGVETIRSYGSKFANSLIKTVEFIGQIELILRQRDLKFYKFTRKTIVAYHLGTAKGNDSHIRTAMLKKYGEQIASDNIVIHSDMWQALAVTSITYDLAVQSNNGSNLDKPDKQ
jgi:Holliday junction resolvasome RuvABC endonuclease subunit